MSNFYKNLSNKLIAKQVAKDEIKDIKFNLASTGFDENVSQMFGEPETWKKTADEFLAEKGKSINAPLDTASLSPSERSYVDKIAKRKGKTLFTSGTLPKQKQKALDPNLMSIQHDSKPTWDLINNIKERITKNPLKKCHKNFLILM